MLMPIIQANATHTPQVRHLLHTGRHVYGSFGDEDLPALLDKALALLGEAQGAPWGFLCIQVEDRPTTLPSLAPDRAYLRALALDRGRSPSQDVVALMEVAMQQLHTYARPVEIIVYGGETWFIKPLLTAGFVMAERVAFFRLALERRATRTPVWPWAGGLGSHKPPSEVAQLRAMQPSDIETLAQLDAETFTPLWHFGAKDLWELLFRARAQVALLDDQLVGYAAISVTGDEAHLARLAVHPAAQGRGIGHQLLRDCIAYAQDNHLTAIALNTQVSNERSQRLYRQLGFRPTGLVLSVLTKTISPINIT